MAWYSQKRRYLGRILTEEALPAEPPIEALTPNEQKAGCRLRSVMESISGEVEEAVWYSLRCVSPASY